MDKITDTIKTVFATGVERLTQTDRCQEDVSSYVDTFWAQYGPEWLQLYACVEMPRGTTTTLYSVTLHIGRLGIHVQYEDTGSDGVEYYGTYMLVGMSAI